MLAPLLLIGVFLAPDLRVSSLDEALAARQEGRRDVRIPRSVATEAARLAAAQRTTLPPDRLADLLQVALDGQAHGALALSLAKLLASDGSHVEPALRALARMPADERAPVCAALGAAGARPSLAALCVDEDEELARGALDAVVPASLPREVVALVATFHEEGRTGRARYALAAARLARDPAALFDELTRMDVPADLEAAVGDALRALLERDGALPARAIELGAVAPSRPLLRALVAVPPAEWERAAELTVELTASLAEDLGSLEPAEVDLLVAAVETAGALRTPAIIEWARRLADRSAPVPVRVAALRALGIVGARDAATIDLLISCVREPGPAGAAAYASLLARAGVRLPQRFEMWTDWRSRQDLPAEVRPEDHASRLAEERALVRRARDREARERTR